MNINLLKHCCTCAFVAYKFLKENAYPEDLCRRGYFLGYIHDCMKPFENPEERNHGELMYDFLPVDLATYVLNHGMLLDADEYYDTLFSALLFADYTVTGDGRFTGFEGRLEDVRNRYGENTKSYNDTLKNINLLKARGFEIIEQKLLSEWDLEFNTDPFWYINKQ